MLEQLGATSVAVKTTAQLEGLDGIVLPGGESTTISLLLDRGGVLEPLRAAIAGGLPTFGTCAGLVLLAAAVLDGRPDQHQVGGLDVVVRRNGYGRQLQSFECVLDGHGALEGSALKAVFIRAPIIESVGAGVEVLSSLDRGGVERAVLVRQGSVMASAFHPELTGETAVHALFLEMVATLRAGSLG